MRKDQSFRKIIVAIQLKIFLVSALLFLTVNMCLSSGLSGEFAQGNALDAFAGVSAIFALTLCCSTAYFNAYPGIRRSLLYSASSFLLLPIAALALVRTSGSGNANWSSLYQAGGSFMVVDLFFWIRFAKLSKRQDRHDGIRNFPGTDQSH
jgi:hypothetical protein